MVEKYFMLINLDQDGYHLEEFDSVDGVNTYLESVDDPDCYDRVLIKGSVVQIKKILVVDKR